MVTTEIITNGLLGNEKLVKGASNPWENHEYEKRIEYTEDITIGATIINREWFFRGINPNGLYINSDGVIHGRVLDFTRQPSVKNLLPKETMLEDGSNWRNLGGLDGTTYTFNFEVGTRVEYLRHLGTGSIGYPEDEIITDISEYINRGLTISYLEESDTTGDSNGVGSEDSEPVIDKFILEYETVYSDVSIMVIKNHDTENLAFVLAYFKAGHMLTNDGVTYDSSNAMEFVSKHPGPFGL